MEAAASQLRHLNYFEPTTHDVYSSPLGNAGKLFLFSRTWLQLLELFNVLLYIYQVALKRITFLARNLPFRSARLHLEDNDIVLVESVEKHRRVLLGRERCPQLGKLFNVLREAQ